MFEIWSLGKKPFQGFDNITVSRIITVVMNKSPGDNIIIIIYFACEQVH